MSTIGYQLNILRDTQMVQRRRLEKMFPYIEWDRMPFSSYNDFFRLRGILDDCGAVWTNAYGRSNTDAEDTRKYLRDYSGNGRDIELFNFGYSKQSGFNGYVQDFRLFENAIGTEAMITEGSIKTTNTIPSGTWILSFYGMTKYVNKEWRVVAEIEEGASASLVFYVSATNTQIVSVPFHNGLNVIPVQDYGEATAVAISLSRGKSLTLTQVPNYRGAIVGDGVDDYGQCVKDFALPDDYTVVAMREMLSNINGCTLAKMTSTLHGAFLFENQGNNTFSYGSLTSVSFPKLFSYQTKSSYNGTTISSGSTSDSDTYKLKLFHQTAQNTYNQEALYSFGVFTRTLTAEEMRIVENCMYAEWICMTGKLDSIEYYDILDARFRSNSEAEDKRNRWVGRLGKLHMTLNNYAYSGNSGWNGETGEDGKPLYGGALVSDGVDDNAVSDEVIDEEIGGVVCHVGYLDNTLAYTYGLAVVGSVRNNRLYLQRAQSGTVYIGHPQRVYAGAFPLLLALDRTPVAPAAKLYVGGSQDTRGKCALYQLRLIKNQPTDVQLEAIKWQCRKEHDDYLIHMGWKEVE